MSTLVDLVICLDCSGSMVTVKNGVINNIYQLLNQLCLLSNISWRFALLGFAFEYNQNKHFFK